MGGPRLDPHLIREAGTNKRLTTLDCQLGNHRGVFTIGRTVLGWACDDCLIKAARRGVFIAPWSPDCD